jgi:GH25 family lysozyme M1 (1,4-beta-N-acetylmuramidase)
MHRRSRIIAGLALSLVALQMTPAVAGTGTPTPSPAFCLLCAPTPTPSPTPKPTATPKASATPSVSASATATASASATPTGSPTPTTINGPDVASYQHPATATYPNGKPINWNAVAGDGMSFAFVKATEGSTYANPFFSQDYTGIASAGLVRGAYHFARPAYPVASNAEAQASYFVKQLGDVNTAATLPPVLDLEVTGGLPRADLVTWAQIFLYRVRALTGRTPMLYTYPSFWTDVLDDSGAFSRFPLWMASYATAAPAADLWQYTDSASIDGISGKVDESTFLGTTGLPWAELSDGTATQPWATAAPKAPHTVTAVGGPASATVAWVPGNDGSARTTSYTVTSDPGGITAKVNGDTNTATVTGLDPATTYTFTVTATSGAGTSAASTATGSVTPVVDTQLAPTQPSSIDYGKPLAITAILTRTDTKAPVANQTVTVMKRAPSKTTWTTVGTETTDKNGNIAVTLHPTQAVVVKLAFAGQSGYQPSSATTTTVVHSVVTAVLSEASVKHSKTAANTVTLTGTVAPFQPGELVYLQDIVKGAWVTMRSKAVNVTGGYTFKLQAGKKKTTKSYRVTVVAADGLAAGISPTAVLTVT